MEKEYKAQELPGDTSSQVQCGEKEGKWMARSREVTETLWELCSKVKI